LRADLPIPSRLSESMETVLVAITIIIVSGIIAILFRRYPGTVSIIGASGIVAGCCVGLFSTILTLLNGQTESLQWHWSVPGGAFSVGLDPISALFLLIIFAISIPVSIYGASYLWHSRRNFDLGTSWFFTSLLIASMALVVIARNAILFLVSWEMMSLSSLFLVLAENNRDESPAAGWIYIVAAHIGTAFLLALFIILGQNGSLEFSQFYHPAHAGLLFILCIIGFGVKAGFVPLHVWLPEAHPAAPSHISALMSGVMIKMGIYGILRTITFLGPVAEWWGWLLLGIGLTSGILGVLYAIAQHDLKRLLAYHSVENIGIISIGLGIGILGISYQAPVIAILGFGGGLLHIINHALFKALLFMAAGSVAHAAGTREIDRLGGILKKMPWTGAMFLIGSIAICGLPPLNGFISEFLIYLGAINSGAALHNTMAIASIITILGLSLIGGLAVACFTKAFGIVFLGEPRTVLPKEVRESGFPMRFSMVLLALGCLAIGLLAPLAWKLVSPVIAQVSRLPIETAGGLYAQGSATLTKVIIASSIGCGLIILITLLRLALLRGKKINHTVTWDCGYALPSARMQYTAASFAQPILSQFRMLLGYKHKKLRLDDTFPRETSLHSETQDVFQRFLFKPLFWGAGRGLDAFRWLQHGNVNLYILYILLTLLALMFWKLK
jgi:hydrogenase-4 component B